MKKKLLIIATAFFITLTLNGYIKEKNNEIFKKEIVEIQNKPKDDLQNMNITIERFEVVPEVTPKERFEVMKAEKPKINKVKELYNKLELNGKLQYKIFQMAMKGLDVLNPPQKDYIAIVDFTQDSDKNRFFMIDLAKETIVYNDLVAHGMNTGEKEAKYFSNEDNSHESSLGFYMTAESYFGSNGYSLSLDGLDKGLNDNARKRAIVLHGASYVSESNIAETGRIGRSWGCPAIRPEIYKDVINKLKGGSLLFLYANEYDTETSVLKGINFKKA